MTVLLDRNGCLTDAGFQALDGAPVGNAPADLATHLAGCARCQHRLLARAAARAGGAEKRPARRPPPPWRVWVILGAFLAMLVMLFVTAQRLIGG